MRKREHLTDYWNQPGFKFRKPRTERSSRGTEIVEKWLVDVTGIEPATSCLQSTRSPS
jgi:hypothetical protein